MKIPGKWYRLFVFAFVVGFAVGRTIEFYLLR